MTARAVRTSARTALEPADLAHVQRLLANECGLAVDPERQDWLCAGLAERMAERKIASLAEYWSMLGSSSERRAELQALIETLTIGETYFFRNQAQFDLLRDHLLPALARERQVTHRGLTIWSAACSTGEEPYSIAMLVLEAVPPAARAHVSILATDVNGRYLRRAERGVYGRRAVHAVPPALLEKYFRPCGTDYVIDDAVQRLVRFERHNLATDPYTLPGMSATDLIFCRNAVMYFTAERLRVVIDRLADCLRDGGYLFTGDAETLWQVSQRFVPVQHTGVTVYQKRSERDRRLDDAPGAPASIGRCDGAALVPPPTFTAPADTTLAEARRLADRGEDEAAIRLLTELVRADPLAIQAHYLLGVLHQTRGELAAAVADFERALYLDPTDALAHMSLATVYRQQRDHAKALRALHNAFAALEGKPDDAPVSFSDSITCGYLRSACRQMLERLSAS